VKKCEILCESKSGFYNRIRLSNQVVDLPAVAVTKGYLLSSSSARDIMRITLHHRGVLIASHSLISEQAKFDLGSNIYRNAAATAIPPWLQAFYLITMVAG